MVAQRSLSAVPMSPLLPGALRRLHRNAACVLDAGPHVFTSSATAAIFQALQLACVGDGDEVLLPAYLCESMLEAVQATGATAVFYRMRADLQCDLEDIAARISPRSKLLLAAHLLGVVQDGPALRALCDVHGLLLLEDCAHAFWRSEHCYPVGSLADYAVASLPKFFPAFEGGVLVSARQSLQNVENRAPGLLAEVKGFYNALEPTARYRRSLSVGAIMALPLWLRDRRRTARPPALTQAAPAGSVPGYIYFEPDKAGLRATLASRLICRFADGEGQIAARRHNFRFLHKHLAGLPLTGSLPLQFDDSFTPYVYPLLVEQPEMVARLRAAGLPFWMWEHIHNTVCDTSRHYAAALLQLPCHQSLTRSDLQAMVDGITAAIKDWQTTAG